MKRIPLLFCVLLIALCSCQNAPLHDLIDYHKVSDRNIDKYQPEITLRFSRSANLFELASTPENDMKADLALAEALDQDKTVKNIKAEGKINVAKGTVVKVLGYANPVGQRKFQPDFFLNADPWLVQLPDGRKAYMAVPEMAIGVLSKKGNTITDVRINQDKSVDAPYQYRIKMKSKDGGPDIEDWSFHPKFYYKAWQDLLVYSYPRRHNNIKSIPVWSFFSEHNFRAVFLPDDAYYLYRPLIKMSTTWSLVVQFVLTPLILMILLLILLPKLVLRMIWWIRPLPNWLVKVITSLGCFFFLFILCAFLECGLIGTAFYFILGLTLEYTKFVSMDVNWDRCPHCHRIGLHYEGTHYGQWQESSSHRDQKEVKYSTSRDYTKGDGTKVHEVTDHIGTKRYSLFTRRRNYTEHFECPYCKREISYNDTEEISRSSERWL